MGGCRWRSSLPQGLFAILVQWSGCAAAASQPEPLPSPLTLEQALVIADDGHPERARADASLAQAAALSRQARAADDLRLGFTAALRVVEPSDLAYYQSRNDSQAHLSLSKPLYDFGRTSRVEEAAAAGLASRRWWLLDVRLGRRLAVMQRFFAVLLADLEFAKDNEALSIAYVRFDKARNRQELGKVSEIEVLELENLYQQSRRELAASRNKQRITRSQLAISLNRPLDLPSHLEAPALAVEDLGGEYEVWVARVLRENPGLLALRAEVEAASKRIQVSEAQDNPVLRGELEASAYKRELGGRDPLSAALVFEMPLYSGGRVDAKIAEQRALLQQKRAELAARELELRQQVLDIWMELDRLQVDGEALQVTADFRDLNLDRSRTLYDLEMQTDLGDSMAQIADIQWRRARNRYDILLLQARLRAMAGMGLMDDGEGQP